MIAVRYLVAIVVPWALKTVLYHYAFRWRKIHASFQSKLIVAGTPILVSGFLPIPLTAILRYLIGVGVGTYICKQYTDGKLYPDIVGIVGGIELIGSVVIEGIIVPALV